MTMPTFKVTVIWECVGEMEIEADNASEAIDKAYSGTIGLPEGEYISDSLIVDEVEKVNNR